MKMTKLLALGALIALVGASTAHAGRRLTTSASGLSDGIECTVVNSSESKTIRVKVNARGAFGNLLNGLDELDLPPLNRTVLVSNGTDRWCEFIVISGGAAKDLRASMLVYEGGLVTAIEPAREK